MTKNNNFVSFSFENENIIIKGNADLSNSNITDFLLNLANMTKCSSNDNKNVKKDESNINNLKETTIRSKRLPNNTDDIDLNNYDITQKKSTFHKNFMCPKCNQRMSIKINGHIVFKDVLSTDENINYQLFSRANDLINKNKDIIDMDSNDLLDLIEESDVGIVNNDEMKCECIQCGAEDYVDNWVKKYNENISNLKEICPICGGEMIFDVKTHKYICDSEKCLE